MDNKAFSSEFTEIALNCEESNSEELAIEVNSACFEYTKNRPVLDDVNLRIPKGKIFALLGPNGTGKTTLMRSILGRLQLKSGSIRVFGVRAGSKESDIPGPGAGYMPQELALFEEFTIQEILKYYGTIYHLKSDELNKRIDGLIKLLNLPEKSRTLSRLSGGQRRRVSIAITMIHRPKLIILDEPTVGVDSILRKKIWNYLDDICRKYGQTVLITTHYIEEARSASNLAFMNKGTILEQSSPEFILNQYNCQTLEEVFLILCQNRIKSLKSGTEVKIFKPEVNVKCNNNFIKENVIKKTESKTRRHENNKSFDWYRIKAMLMKYTILTIRRPLYLVMYYVIPVIALVSMRLSVGQSPFDLNVAVFNADLNPELSQKFIDSIDKNYITINKYEDNRTAYESVVSGKNYVSIVFSENFTETFETRLTDLLQMDDFEIDNSQIRLYMDFSNAVVGAFVLKYMIEAFKAFCDTLTQSFGSNLFRFLSPVQVTECVYGSLDLDVTAHFGPSALVVVANSLPMILSAFNIVNDRKTASFERVFVAGVRPIEYFIAHTVINVFLVISQVMCSTFISFVILQNTQLGNYMEVFAVLTLQGYMGLSIGLMGSLLLADEVSVAVGVTGFMLPIWIMSGVLWPLEAIPFYFRYISDLSPITLPLDALRSIMLRGWSYTRPNVLYGYGISIFYSVVFTLLNMIIFQKFTDKAFSLQFWNF